MLKSTFKSRVFYSTILFFIISIFPSFGQQLHLNCSPEASKFSWDRSPSGNTEFDWSDGTLSNTINNIANSGVNATITFSGNTNSLARWPGSNTTSDSPAVGTDATGSDNLQFYTEGFSNADGVTITITLSEPVYAVGFDLLHINTSGQSGDKYTISASTSNGSTVFPSFINATSASYTFDNSTGTINSTGSSAGSESRIGVNFSEEDKLTTITIQWQDCET